MEKIDHVFIYPYELQFLFVFQSLCPKGCNHNQTSQHDYFAKDCGPFLIFMTFAYKGIFK
jgi:hypothetical protein